ncbi:hypothetical protein ACWEN3_45200 [Streptomyces sp. NPDC004561]
MRSRFAARSGRLVLAALAAAALTATASATAVAAGGQSRTHAAHQACATRDLTCYLEGTIPTAAFGTAPETRATPPSRPSPPP